MNSTKSAENAAKETSAKFESRTFFFAGDFGDQKYIEMSRDSLILASIECAMNSYEFKFNIIHVNNWILKSRTFLQGCYN